MSKSIKSALALAGVKGAALAAALGDVVTYAARAILHGDCAAFVDTVKESDETRGAAALAVRETFTQAVDLLKATRTGATWAPAETAPAWSRGFKAPARPEALAQVTAPGKRTAAEESAAAAWSRDFGNAWADAFRLHMAAAAAAKVTKGAAKDCAAAKDRVTKAAEALAATLNAEGMTPEALPQVQALAAKVEALGVTVSAQVTAVEALGVEVTNSATPTTVAEGAAALVKVAAEAAEAAEGAATEGAALVTPVKAPADTMQGDGDATPGLMAQVEALTAERDEALAQVRALTEAAEALRAQVRALTAERDTLQALVGAKADPVTPPAPEAAPKAPKARRTKAAA